MRIIKLGVDDWLEWDMDSYRGNQEYEEEILYVIANESIGEVSLILEHVASNPHQIRFSNYSFRGNPYYWVGNVFGILGAVRGKITQQQIAELSIHGVDEEIIRKLGTGEVV